MNISGPLLLVYISICISKHNPLRGKFPGHKITGIYSTLINNVFLVSTGLYQFILLPVMSVSVAPYLQQHLEPSDLKFFTNLIGMYRYPIVFLICLFLVNNDIECLIKSVLTIGHLFCKCLLKSLDIFFCSIVYIILIGVYIFYII